MLAIISSPLSIDLQILNSMLAEYFYEPDTQAIRISLGAIKAHTLDVGDATWMFVIAPPGTGKTSISIMGSAGLPGVVQFGDFSENTFLSGFYGKEQPGVLEKLGEPFKEGDTLITYGDGIFLAKDFTTVLSMRREKRAGILSQLREIYDGEFVRTFGTGQTKIWRGRITMIAAVTPELDRHISIFSTLGERFLQVRWHRPKSEQAGVMAIAQQGQEAFIRTELQATVKAMFENSVNTTPLLSKDMVHRIACMAEITALARTHVHREGHGNREIEHVPEPEANTRLSKGLAGLAMGIAALNQRQEVAEEDLQDVLRVGMDSIPPSRKLLILAAATGQDFDSLGLARTVMDRQVEELQVLGILDRDDERVLSERVERLLTVADTVEVR